MKMHIRMAVTFFCLNLLLTIQKTACAKPSQTPGSAKISVHFKNANPGDTISCKIEYFDNVSGKRQYYAILDRNCDAVFTIDLTETYGYVSVGRDFSARNNEYIPVVGQYPIADKDDVHINIEYETPHPSYYVQVHRGLGFGPDDDRPLQDKHTIGFSGKGSEKMKFYADDVREGPIFKAKVANLRDDSLFNQDRTFNIKSSAYLYRKYLIDVMVAKYKATLTKRDLAICKADLVGEMLYEIGRSVEGFLESKGPEYFQDSYFPKFRNIINELSIGIPDEVKDISRGYADGVYEVELADFRRGGVRPADGNFYQMLKRDYAGELKDRLLTSFLISKIEHLRNPDSLLTDALRTIHDTYCKGLVEKLAVRFKGAKALDFTLTRTDGSKVSLADFKDKVIFMDYYDFACGACVAFYLHDLKFVEEHFKDNNNVVFLIVDLDASKDAWLNCIKSGNFTSADGYNLINVYSNGKGFDDPIVKNYQIYGMPCPILIDKNGRIMEYNNSDRTKEHIIESVNAALNEME